jgi:hypothetical protein
LENLYFVLILSLINRILITIFQSIYFKNTIDENAEIHSKIIEKVYNKGINKVTYRDKLKSAFSKVRVIVSLIDKKMHKINVAARKKNSFDDDKVDKKLNYIKRFQIDEELLRVKDIIISREFSANSQINLIDAQGTNNIINGMKRKINNFEKNDILEVLNNDKNIFKAENTENFFLKAKYDNNNDKIRGTYKISNCNYQIKLETSYGISYFNLRILYIKQDKFEKFYFRKKIKSFFIIILLCIFWYGDLYFMQIIYKQYGNKILKICFLPFIITLVINNLFTSNVLILINTVILFFFGKEIVYGRRLNFFKRLIIKIFVSRPSLLHYSAFLNYLEN